METNFGRRGFLKGAGLAGFGFLGSTGCMPTPAGSGEREPDAVTVSQTVDASTMDPQKQGSMTDMSILINIFDTLTTRDARSALAPSLALQWKAITDKTWRFKLRKGVRFHNGEPFNAETVKYSVERILDPETRSPIVELNLVDHVDVADDHTVDFKMSEPDPLLPEKLSLFGGVMVPPRYIEEKGANHFAANPVGTGPFTFTSWHRGAEVRLAANAEYWGDPPTVPKVIFRKIPSPADALAAVRAGEIDIVSDITPDAAIQLQGAPEVRVAATEGIRTYFVSLNTEAGGPLADPSVRRALNHAINMEAVVETLLGGYATRTATLVPRQSPAHVRSVHPYSYDPALARQLLAQAGYGQGFSVTFSAQNKEKYVAQALAGLLRKVGVQARLELLDPGTFEQQYLSKNCGDLGSLFLFGTTPWTLTAWSSFASWVPSDSPQSRFSDARADDLFETIETSVDQSTRLRAAAKLQQLLKEEAPFIYLHQMDNIYAVRKRVRWKPNAIGLLRMRDASIRTVK